MYLSSIFKKSGVFETFYRMPKSLATKQCHKESNKLDIPSIEKRRNALKTVKQYNDDKQI